MFRRVFTAITLALLMCGGVIYSAPPAHAISNDEVATVCWTGGWPTRMIAGFPRGYPNNPGSFLVPAWDPNIDVAGAVDTNIDVECRAMDPVNPDTPTTIPVIVWEFNALVCVTDETAIATGCNWVPRGLGANLLNSSFSGGSGENIVIGGVTVGSRGTVPCVVGDWYHATVDADVFNSQGFSYNGYTWTDSVQINTCH